MNYEAQYQQFIQSVSSVGDVSADQLTLEIMFESTRDWSSFGGVEHVKNWLKDQRKRNHSRVFEIGLNYMQNWQTSGSPERVQRSDLQFYSLRGFRVYQDGIREVAGSWDQPLIVQAGFDGGVLGLLRQRFEGIPHYLVNAKFEPGNVDEVLISPTLQATFANLQQKHGGRKPHFAEFFEDNDDLKTVAGLEVLFSSWIAEDGGRLYKKRNKIMLVEIDSGIQVTLPSDQFLWVSWFQLKQLCRDDCLVSPHIRAIMSYA